MKSNKLGENIIGALKIRNTHGAALLFCFPAIAILDFSLLLLVKLSLLIFFALFLVLFLCFIFGIISLQFFSIALSKVIALPTIALAIVLALRADSENILLFAIASKSDNYLRSIQK